MITSIIQRMKNPPHNNNTIDKIIPKLYVDNAEGKLDDDRLSSMVDDLQKESVAIKKELLELSEEAVLTSKSDNYKMFF